MYFTIHIPRPVVSRSKYTGLHVAGITTVVREGCGLGGGISSNSSSGTDKASTLEEYDVPSRTSFVTFVRYLKNSISCF